MSGLSTHVLDTARGAPAGGLAVRVETATDEGWRPLARGVTDAEGRIRDLLGELALEARAYRLVFETEGYLRATGQAVFYPRVEVSFVVTTPAQHHHIPLLLSPFGYATYRGT